ncbi:MAG: hypothetical protein J6S98_10110 [Lentisphaeria bacterium]|nr:hypothetical protein [Lentisphaeria bacterium]
MCSLRTILTVFFLFAAVSLRAFDACLHIDTEQAKMLPGWNAIQSFLYPELAAETENKLKQRGLELAISKFILLTEGDVFDLQLQGISETQLKFLLQHKMIHPDWTYQKEDGVYRITNGKETELTIQPLQNGLRFTNGTIRQKVFLNFKPQKGTIIQGVLLCTPEKDQHPALTDVRIIYFYLNKAAGKVVLDFFIRGKDPEADKRIAADLNLYFAKLYANAAQETAFDASLLNIYRVSTGQGWVKLRITLTPEQAEIFFTQFGTALKDMLPR